MIKRVKTGEAVFLTIHPEYRGNVSKVEKDRFQVTWHKSYSDVPPAQGETIDRRNSRRMRVWYPNDRTSVIGFGVPSA
jgi:hypothetical protein